MENFEWTDREKQLFNSLSREASPPEELESAVSDKLRRSGFIKPETHRLWTPLKWAATIVLAAASFYTGIIYQQNKTTLPMEINPNLGYMLILHEDESFNPGEPMEMFEEYSEWMESTMEKGVKIDGQELAVNAVKVSSRGTDVPDGSDRVTGYFILEANSMDEAVAVARANPHIKYGGTIEVKPFMVR